MYQRKLAPYLKKYLKQYPIVTLTGPRQAGKTTLVESHLKDYTYVSLEDPDTREYALQDPRGFLDSLGERAIIDEAQQGPELFSYLQGRVDKNSTPGQFVLTGSQQFLLNEKISQTLAGRAARLRLFPLSTAELWELPSQEFWHTGALTKFSSPEKALYTLLFQGLYPRVHQHDLDPRQFYRDYVNTYVTRDLQQLLKVGDLHVFQNFLRLLAGRVGQPVNLTSLGNDLGISHPTINRWLSVLEASYIIYRHYPHFKNFNKRLTKTPKVYFLDSGLLCYLLRIQKAEELPFHPFIGGIFESFVISEIYKSFYQRDQEPPLYFWQNQSKKEVDCLIDRGLELLPIEIKASQTIKSHFFSHLEYWLGLQGNTQGKGCVVYAGEDWQKRGCNQVIPWYALS